MTVSRRRKRGGEQGGGMLALLPRPCTFGSKLSGLPSPRSFKPSVLTIWEVVSRTAEVKCIVSHH